MEYDILMHRVVFEKHICLTYGSKHKQPWSIIERSDGDDSYLDLYTQRRWEGWQAALCIMNG